MFGGGAPTPILHPFPYRPSGFASSFKVSRCPLETYTAHDNLDGGINLLGGREAGVRRWECAGVQVGHPLPAGTTHGARFPRRGRTQCCHKPSASVPIIFDLFVIIF